MRRRTFMAALGAAAALPLVARAQAKIPRVGYLWIGSPGLAVVRELDAGAFNGALHRRNAEYRRSRSL
jgi:hypothetical protein